VTVPDFASPREAAGAFTPSLSNLIASPVYDRGGPRSIEAGSQPRHRGRDDSNGDGPTRGSARAPAAAEEHGGAELSALITHLAFYTGFAAAITASAIADATFSQAPVTR
jgi:4-carboxymuconolactone decarboxylase